MHVFIGEEIIGKPGLITFVIKCVEKIGVIKIMRHV